MTIGSLSDLASFLVNLKNGNAQSSSQNLGQQISQITRSPNAVGNGRDNAPGQVSKEAAEIQPTPEEPVEIPESDSSPAPTPGPSTPSPSSGNESLRELAILYVEQFEQGTNRVLEEEDFNSRVEQVTELYSSIQGGKERLDNIVFANDVKETDVEA